MGARKTTDGFNSGSDWGDIEYADTGAITAGLEGAQQGPAKANGGEVAAPTTTDSRDIAAGARLNLDWPEALTTGAPIRESQANYVHFLERLGVVLKYNAFSCKEWLVREPHIFRLDDALERKLRLLANEYGFKCTPALSLDILRNEARKNTHHPVADYLNICKKNWDGEERLDQWLSTYAGVPDSPFVRAAARLTLIAAVRRIRQPGCKFDTALVLEGAQGVGKSMLCETLASAEFFTDNFSLMSEAQKVIEQTEGKWIVELPELVGIWDSKVEQVKALLSRQVDTSRLAYGRLTEERPRQFIFIGTTNGDKYLKDPTGNRRIWPVKVGRVDIEKLALDRAQLWGEAAHCEARGDSLVLPEDLWAAATAEQLARTQLDPWQEVVEERLSRLKGQHPDVPGLVITKAAIRAALGLDTQQTDNKKQARIDTLMTSLGFTGSRRRHPVTGDRPYVYVEQGAESQSEQAWHIGALFGLSV